MGRGFSFLAVRFLVSDCGPVRYGIYRVSDSLLLRASSLSAAVLLTAVNRDAGNSTRRLRPR